MKNIYYYFYTDCCNGISGGGLITIPDYYNEQDIQKNIDKLIIDKALFYGLDKNELNTIHSTWRIATIKDLENWESMSL